MNKLTWIVTIVLVIGIIYERYLTGKKKLREEVQIKGYKPLGLYDKYKRYHNKLPKTIK